MLSYKTHAYYNKDLSVKRSTSERCYSNFVSCDHALLFWAVYRTIPLFKLTKYSLRYLEEKFHPWNMTEIWANLKIWCFVWKVRPLRQSKTLHFLFFQDVMLVWISSSCTWSTSSKYLKYVLFLLLTGFNEFLNVLNQLNLERFYLQNE